MIKGLTGYSYYPERGGATLGISGFEREGRFVILGFFSHSFLYLTVSVCPSLSRFRSWSAVVKRGREVMLKGGQGCGCGCDTLISLKENKEGGGQRDRDEGRQR